MSVAATTSNRPSPLKLVFRETRYQQLLFWRNRFGALFTVVFSSLFLILLSATNTGRIAALHHIKYAQYYTPGFMAYGLMSACFNNLAISTVARRETGLLKRLRLSPLPGWALIASLIISAGVVSLASAALLVFIGIIRIVLFAVARLLIHDLEFLKEPGESFRFHPIKFAAWKSRLIADVKK